jgi:hypothetical protein
MNDNRDIEFIRESLKTVFPPWPDHESSRDLWPRMRIRIEQAPPAFGWFEAALALLVLAAFGFFPELIPVLLYHL